MLKFDSLYGKNSKSSTKFLASTCYLHHGVIPQVIKSMKKLVKGF